MESSQSSSTSVRTKRRRSSNVEESKSPQAKRPRRQSDSPKSRRTLNTEADSELLTLTYVHNKKLPPDYYSGLPQQGAAAFEHYVSAFDQILEEEKTEESKAPKKVVGKTSKAFERLENQRRLEELRNLKSERERVQNQTGLGLGTCALHALDNALRRIGHNAGELKKRKGSLNFIDSNAWEREHGIETIGFQHGKIQNETYDVFSGVYGLEGSLGVGKPHFNLNPEDKHNKFYAIEGLRAAQALKSEGLYPFNEDS